MTIPEAKQSIGKRFTLDFIKLNYNKRADVIKEVREDGTVVGEFLEAPAEDVRLINEPPPHLSLLNQKTKSNESTKI